MKDEENNKEKDNLVESNIIDDVFFVESTEDGEALPTKDVAKKLREELKACRKEKEEYLTGWQRAKADYINLQKELYLIRANSTILVKEKVVKNFLPVLDSFEMAFANKEHWEKVDKEWRNGIEYIHQQFINGLFESGIQQIDAIDIPFDPQIHHSVKIIETSEKEKDQTVAEIVQIGYKIVDSIDSINSSGQGRIIRPASVNVYGFKKNC